jgi:hypothetical protein
MLVTMTAFGPALKSLDVAPSRPPRQVGARPAPTQELTPAAAELLAEIRLHEGEPVATPLMLKLTIAVGFGLLTAAATGIAARLVEAAGLLA